MLSPSRPPLMPALQRGGEAPSSGTVNTLAAGLLSIPGKAKASVLSRHSARGWHPSICADEHTIRRMKRVNFAPQLAAAFSAKDFSV